MTGVSKDLARRRRPVRSSGSSSVSRSQQRKRSGIRKQPASRPDAETVVTSPVGLPRGAAYRETKETEAEAEIAPPIGFPPMPSITVEDPPANRISEPAVANVPQQEESDGNFPKRIDDFVVAKSVQESEPVLTNVQRRTRFGDVPGQSVAGDEMSVQSTRWKRLLQNDSTEATNVASKETMKADTGIDPPPCFPKGGTASLSPEAANPEVVPSGPPPAAAKQSQSVEPGPSWSENMTACWAKMIEMNNQSIVPESDENAKTVGPEVEPSVGTAAKGSPAVASASISATEENPEEMLPSLLERSPSIEAATRIGIAASFPTKCSAPAPPVSISEVVKKVSVRPKRKPRWGPPVIMHESKETSVEQIIQPVVIRESKEASLKQIHSSVKHES